MKYVELKHLSATSPAEDTPLVMVTGTKIQVAEIPALKKAQELGRRAGECLKNLFKEK